MFRKGDTVKKLNDEEAIKVIAGVDRAERLINPLVYRKAVRATMLALGYDERWVESRFRELLDGAYPD